MRLEHVYILGMLGFVTEIISIGIGTFLHTGDAHRFEIGAFQYTVDALMLFSNNFP